MHCPIHNTEHTRPADVFFLERRGVCESVYHKQVQDTASLWSGPEPKKKPLPKCIVCGKKLSHQGITYCWTHYLASKLSPY